MPQSSAATYSSAASPAMNGTELTPAAASTGGTAAGGGGQKTGDALGQALASVSTLCRNRKGRWQMSESINISRLYTSSIYLVYFVISRVFD